MHFSNFTVIRDFPSLATRESGMQARQIVLGALEDHSHVTLDFSGAHSTPSFADELVGKLAAILGKSAFRSRVRVIGVDDAERILLQHVIARRMSISLQQETHTLHP
jgi:hypothetical protein